VRLLIQEHYQRQTDKQVKHAPEILKETIAKDVNKNHLVQPGIGNKRRQDGLKEVTIVS
jgi:hypothetical protein